MSRRARSTVSKKMEFQVSRDTSDVVPGAATGSETSDSLRTRTCAAASGTLHGGGSASRVAVADSDEAKYLREALDMRE